MVLWKTQNICAVLVLLTALCAASDPLVPTQMASHKLVCEEMVKAINAQNWNYLQEVTAFDIQAPTYIKKWQKNPVHVGKLIKVENDFKFNGVSCTKYSYLMEFPDGKPYPHLFQILIHDEAKGLTIPDFWEFGW